MRFSRQEYWSGLPFPSPSYALLSIKHLCRSNRHLRLSWFNCTLPTQHLSIGILKVKVTQSYPTLCDPMDYTVHGILQARIMEWVASLYSSRSSWPRNRTGVSYIAGGFLTSWATREVFIGVSVDGNFTLPVILAKNPGTTLDSSCSHTLYFQAIKKSQH